MCGGGGGATKREERGRGTIQVAPLPKRMGGGGRNNLAMLKWGHKMFCGIFNMGHFSGLSGDSTSRPIPPTRGIKRPTSGTLKNIWSAQQISKVGQIILLIFPLYCH